MENASNEKLVIEEREEDMVSEKGRCMIKTHFLKPFVASINGGSVAELPRSSGHYSVFSSELLKVFSLRTSFSGFWVADDDFVSWLENMETLYAPTWRKAGIYEAIKASTYTITKNSSLILSVSEKWCPETKSFVFPWGEATITLEDVMVLLGFSVLGSPVFVPLESSEMKDSVEKLEKARLEITRRDGHVGQGSWISRFIGRADQMEHEAFLILWLSFYVFPGSSKRRISKQVVPIAVRLARGERTALAPAVLAILYRDLGRIREFIREDCVGTLHVRSLFKLVQIWTWERFKNTRPKAMEIPNGGPRIAQWDGLKQKSLDVKLTRDDFEWRPYTKPFKNWNPLRFYLEDAMWVDVDKCTDDEFASFVRCVRVSQLVGDGFVEDYLPNRVAKQFGLGQDVPGLITYHRNFTEKDAWDDYNKSLDGLKLYMPSRLDCGSVTVRYRSWWLKSISEFVASREMQKKSTKISSKRKKFDFNGGPKIAQWDSLQQKSLDVRLTRDDYVEDDINDHDVGDSDSDVPLKVLPLSQVLQKLEKGFPAKRRRSKMWRRVKNDKICEFMKSLVSSGRKRNKRSSYKTVRMKRAYENDDENSLDDEDDNMTIARWIRSRKDYNDAEKIGGDAIELLGKRSRRYQVVESDDSDSEPCQQSEGDCETARKAQKTMQTCDDFEFNVIENNAEKKSMIHDKTMQNCDDFEVDVIENNAEKKSMINDKQSNGTILQSIGRDGTKKTECLLQEDGEKKRCSDEKLCSEVNKKEDVDESLRMRNLRIKEIALKLETRFMKVEKTLAVIKK